MNVKRWWLKAGLAAAVAAACAVLPTAARAGEPEAMERKILELEARLKAMEAEIAALRTQAAASGGSGAAELQRRIDILAAEIEKLRIGRAAEARPLTPVHGLGPAASRVYGVSGGVSIGGYGEALYENVAATDERGSPSGAIDTLDFVRGILYAGYKFNDKIVFNSEVEFEHGSTERGGSVSVEFAYLDFLLSPHASVRAGMILVPAGFINEMHEPPTFLGARRPDVERLIIPATWSEDGAGVFGDAGPFSYRAYVLNGFDSGGFTADEALREGRQGGAEAKAQDFALAARVDFKGVPGLLAGAFGYHGRSAQGAAAPAGFAFDPNGQPIPPPTRTFQAPVTLHDLHVEYRARGLDLRALAATGRLGDAKQVNDAAGLDGTASIGERFSGWYAQAGYDLLSRRRDGAQSLVPFVRYERLNTQQRVPGTAPVDLDPSPSINPVPFAADPANNAKIWTFGVSYKPIYNVSIKLDYQDINNEAKTGVDQISLALGYLY